MPANVKDKAVTLEDMSEALKRTGNAIPAVTTSDAGKFLRVSSTGEWVAETVPSAESEGY